MVQALNAPPPCRGFSDLIQQTFGLLAEVRKVQKIQKLEPLSFEEELRDVSQAIKAIQSKKSKGILIHPRIIQFIALLTEFLEKVSQVWDELSPEDRDELGPVLEELSYSLLAAVEKPRDLRALYGYLIGSLSLRWASFSLNQDFYTRYKNLFPRVPELILEKVEEHFGLTQSELEDSFRRGWKEVMSGETIPLSSFWEEVGTD